MPFSRNTPMSRWGEDTDPFLVMRREMNRLFDDAFSGFGLPSFFGPVSQQMPAAPKIDVIETDNEIQVTAEMPGIDQNEVEVLLEDHSHDHRDSQTARSEAEATPDRGQEGHQRAQ
jgi:HSP20 family protein